MTYATTSEVTTKIGTEASNITTALMTESIEAAEDTINAALTRADITPITNFTPTSAVDPLNFLLSAGDYFAAAEVLDSLYINRNERSPSAASWEKKAQELLDTYIETQSTSGTAGDKYQYSNTPGQQSTSSTNTELRDVLEYYENE